MTGYFYNTCYNTFAMNNSCQIISGSDFQMTLGREIKIEGMSLSGDSRCSLTLAPAPENTGLMFIVSGVKIPANYSFIKPAIEEYTTILEKDGIEIKTVEHLLSALWGSGIDNAYIKLESGQIPLRDASAEWYCQEIKKAGVNVQKTLRKYSKINKETTLRLSTDPERYTIFKPANTLSIKATSIFNNIIGTQEFVHQWTPENYLQDISWARSFMNSPVPDGGGDKWERVRKTLKVLPEDPKNSPIIVFTKDQYLTPLKAENEPVRHKVLDFYGDISLLGYRLLADITLFKPGHKFNREIATFLANQLPNE